MIGTDITLEVRQQASRDGRVTLIGRREAFASCTKPVILMIHGALRDVTPLLPWLSLLEPDFDVVFVELPGHGRASPLYPVSIENFAANIGDALTQMLEHRRIIVVGESLGGLVALALGTGSLPMVRGIVAADPPLTMGKLWHVTSAVQNHIASAKDRFWTEFAFNIFGVEGDQLDPDDRIYYPLFDHLSVPTYLLTGDLPLFPVRSLAGVPCVIDAVDWRTILRHPCKFVRLERINECGHLLLVGAKDRCLTLIRQLAGEVLGNDVPPQ